MELHLVVVYIAVFILMIVLNSWEIHLLRKSNNKPNYEKILLSLTVCDLMGALIALILTAIITLITYVPINLSPATFWFISGVTQPYWACVSLLHLICISFDRLWAVQSPIHHMTNATKKKLYIAIAFSWLAPTLIPTAYVADTISKGAKMEDMKNLLIMNTYQCGAILVLIADIIFVIVYSVIIGIVRKNRSVTRRYRHGQQEQSKKALVFCICIVLVFVINKAPFVAVYVIKWNSPKWLSDMAQIIFPFDHMLNSIIYLIQKYHKNAAQSAKTSLQFNASNLETRRNTIETEGI